MDTTNVAQPPRYLLSIAAAVLACSCGQPYEVAQDDGVAQTRSPIIFGHHASSQALDHTGAIVATGSASAPELICSGSLLGPRVAVTALHCVEPILLAQEAGYFVAFAIGADATQAGQLIPIANIGVPAPEHAFDYLVDVAVINLEQAPERQLSYPKARSPSDDLLGTPMMTLGYGVHGASGAWDGRRRIGRERLETLSGRLFEGLFGSFEDFVEWYITGEVTDDDFIEQPEELYPPLEELQEIYDSTLLHPQHQGVTRSSGSGTNACFGDSGGPLLRVTQSGEWVTYGVVSSGFPSLRQVCDFGTIFSTFGPVALELIETAFDWEDPCGEVTQAGRCRDGQAERCETDLGAGTRSIVSEDCQAQNEMCVIVDGHAVCGAQPAEELNVRPKERLDFQSLVRKHFLRTAKRASPQWGNAASSRTLPGR